MSNPTEHHHHSRLFYFLTNPTQNNSPALSSTAPIAVAIQDCCRLCCPTPQPTTLSEPVRCKWSSCPESFNQPEDLAPHLFRDHVNKNRKRQPKCYWESCSETVEDLVKHLTSRHLMRLWLACRWRDCSQSFDGFKPLTDHVSKDHVGSGKSEYECDWTACDRQGRAFNQRQKIMRHIQTHTGARPYHFGFTQDS
ncbi:hypothetical protein G6F56_012515 [Rhizopus delemar]|nr:hypothetical protein G6F56_012515 [Rhizopus delemar]